MNKLRRLAIDLEKQGYHAIFDCDEGLVASCLGVRVSDDDLTDIVRDELLIYGYDELKQNVNALKEMLPVI